MLSQRKSFRNLIKYFRNRKCKYELFTIFFVNNYSYVSASETRQCIFKVPSKLAVIIYNFDTDFICVKVYVRPSTISNKKYCSNKPSFDIINSLIQINECPICWKKLSYVIGAITSSSLQPFTSASQPAIVVDSWK